MGLGFGPFWACAWADLGLTVESQNRPYSAILRSSSRFWPDSTNTDSPPAIGIGDPLTTIRIAILTTMIATPSLLPKVRILGVATPVSIRPTAKHSVKVRMLGVVTSTFGCCNTATVII
ncbi:hypothetical protein CRG98_017796 [Punica granatum]|uniref:Uncharacterized protein n=1 Tax=Punica granatum TaxID=22663 RepID=A0A2I0JZS4_PUNGR|nr:hypothetical protein CRG98_017796 [Punica granatum]